MVEVGIWSLRVKVHPEKNRNQKKNAPVVDREFDSLSPTLEFFGRQIFL
jgi:hypothetical protein